MKLMMIAALMAAYCASAMAQSQGVSRNEIVLGTILDLSGPAAQVGKQYRAGLQMRVDEINEQGGINGRRLRLVTEDSKYDARNGVLAAQKLVNDDKVFAVVGAMGTAPAMAAFPVMLSKNVISFLPSASSVPMYEPAHRLKYAMFTTYYDQIRAVLPPLIRQKSSKRVCTIYQDDDFGAEVLRSVEDTLKALGMPLLEKASFKRGATDFSSQVQRLAAQQCDLVVAGGIIRETVGIVTTAGRIGFHPVFVGTNAAYIDALPKLGGAAMNGFYTAMTAQIPYLDDSSEQVRHWALKYQTKFSEAPSVFSIYGYTAMDMFVRAAGKAGPNLTTDSFIEAMDALVVPRDIFGSPEYSFSPTKRLGSKLSRLSQIQDGRWNVVIDYDAIDK